MTEPLSQLSKRKTNHGITAALFLRPAFNNTIVTITDVNGDVCAGFGRHRRLSREAEKSTPFAAQRAARDCSNGLQSFGMKGNGKSRSRAGSGRESAITGFADVLDRRPFD